MSVSQNGWPAVPTSTHLAVLPWITGRVLAGDVATIFDYVCRRFNAEVEPISVGHSWGWAYRDIRNAETLSNHASATAIDLNAPAHPLGAVGTFTAADVAAIRDILRDVSPVVRWGGDYAGRKDEMHFEIVGTAAQVAAVAARLRGVPTGGGQSVAKPTNPPTSEEDDMFTDTDRDRLNYIFGAVAQGESGVRPTGHVLAQLTRIESKLTAAHTAIGNAVVAIKATPGAVWSYTNGKLEKVDVYAIVRSIRDKVVGK